MLGSLVLEDIDAAHAVRALVVTEQSDGMEAEVVGEVSHSSGLVRVRRDSPGKVTRKKMKGKEN